MNLTKLYLKHALFESTCKLLVNLIIYNSRIPPQNSPKIVSYTLIASSVCTISQYPLRDSSGGQWVSMQPREQGLLLCSSSVPLIHSKFHELISKAFCSRLATVFLMYILFSIKEKNSFLFPTQRQNRRSVEKIIGSISCFFFETGHPSWSRFSFGNSGDYFFQINNSGDYLFLMNNSGDYLLLTSLHFFDRNFF